MEWLRKKINLLLFITSVGFLICSFAVKGDEPADLVLEIEGKPSFGARARGTYRVTLIYHNNAVDTLILSVSQPFDYLLNRNSIYAVRIEKDGYLPRLISINTSAPQQFDNESYYSFLFKITMYPEELRAQMDADDLDFPVAVIAYDALSDRFEYGRPWTESLLQRLEAVQSDKITRR